MQLRLFRSRDRDNSTDTRRLGGVRKAVEDALYDATREYNGLLRRCEEFRSRAAFLGEAPEDREASDERYLAEVEGALMRASRRCGALSHQIEALNSLLEMLNSKWSKVAASETLD